MKHFFVTGCGGFVGFHFARALLKNRKNKVIGIDNINSYYDTKLKKDRIAILKKEGKKNFCFYKKNLLNFKELQKIFKTYKIDYIFHFAAQAGVRHSLKYPQDYISNNINVFLNILEICKQYKIKHLIYASTSSVYGNIKKFPIKETFRTDTPIQFYAVSKKTNELMAYSYGSLYGIKSTGLRFFTLYGPWGRPDMALFKFTKNILNNKEIELYNNGNHLRNFTYIDDAVKMIMGIYKISKKENTSRIFNIANPNVVKLKNYILTIEKHLNKKSIQKKMPLQKGDIKGVKADTSRIKKHTKIKKFTDIEKGIKQFISWYKKYYNV